MTPRTPQRFAAATTAGQCATGMEFRRLISEPVVCLTPIARENGPDPSKRSMRSCGDVIGALMNTEITRCVEHMQHDLCYTHSQNGRMSTSQGERLEKARRRAGYEKMSDAVERFGWKYSTYAAHENGQNAITPRSAEKYARAFKCSAAYLLTGEGEATRLTVAIRGHVGAGFEIINFDQDDNDLGQIEVPPGGSPDLLALKVRGDSMQPAFYENDTIYYDPDDARPVHELANRECVVKLRDGRMLVKWIKISPSRRQVILSSYNSDPIAEADVVWACPVRFIQRG